MWWRETPSSAVSAEVEGLECLWKPHALCLPSPLNPTTTRFLSPCRHEGVFIVRGKEDSLVTRNFVPGKTVYNEKLVKVDVSAVHLPPPHSPLPSLAAARYFPAGSCPFIPDCARMHECRGGVGWGIQQHVPSRVCGCASSSAHVATDGRVRMAPRLSTVCGTPSGPNSRLRLWVASRTCGSPPGARSCTWVQPRARPCPTCRTSSGR